MPIQEPTSEQNKSDQTKDRLKVRVKQLVWFSGITFLVISLTPASLAYSVRKKLIEILAKSSAKI